MTTMLSLRVAAVLASTTLVLGGGVAGTGTAFASTPGTATTTATTFPDRGIVCPRGQHAYHAPGGDVVTCIPNGQLRPTPAPPPAG